jgi:rubrerythrin
MSISDASYLLSVDSTYILSPSNDEAGRVSTHMGFTAGGNLLKIMLQEVAKYMKAWESLSDVLDYAIDQEQAAADFYTKLSSQVAHESMREILQGFAEEELRHKKKLQSIKETGATKLINRQAVPDLKVADYVVDVEPTDDMGYQDALVVAMKMEKKAFQLYTDMAAVAEDGGIRQSLLALANEEAKHKLHFEIKYDDSIKEN